MFSLCFQLMVHVGVSGIAKELTLEQQAHNDGYDKCDVKGLCPGDGCCVHSAPCCIVSKLDMKRVKDAVLSSGCGVDCIVSLDPGRYELLPFTPAPDQAGKPSGDCRCVCVFERRAEPQTNRWSAWSVCGWADWAQNKRLAWSSGHKLCGLVSFNIPVDRVRSGLFRRCCETVFSHVFARFCPRW